MAFMEKKMDTFVSNVEHWAGTKLPVTKVR
jgi:hypothetical protein